MFISTRVNDLHFTTRVGNEDVFLCMSFGEGGKFSPSMPKLVGKVDNRPSPELYAFVGGFDVMMENEA